MFETIVQFFYGVPLYQYTSYFEINNDPCLLIRPLQCDIFLMGMFLFAGFKLHLPWVPFFLNRPQEKKEILQLYKHLGNCAILKLMD